MRHHAIFKIKNSLGFFKRFEAVGEERIAWGKDLREAAQRGSKEDIAFVKRFIYDRKHEKPLDWCDTFDFNIMDKFHWTALMYAAANGHTAIVQALLETDVDISFKNLYGRTAADEALKNNHQEVAKLLIAHVSSVINQPPILHQ